MNKVLHKKAITLLLTITLLITVMSGCAFPRQNPDDWREKMAALNSNDTSAEVSSSEELSNGDNSEDNSNSEQGFLENLAGEKSEKYEGVIDFSSIGEGYESVVQIEFINESELLITFLVDDELSTYLYNIYDGSCIELIEWGIENKITLYSDFSAIEYDLDEIAFYKDIRTKAAPYIFSGYDDEYDVVSFNGMLTYIKNQSVYIYNTATDETKELFSLPTEASDYTVVSSEEYLYVNGYDYNEFDEYALEFCVAYSLSEQKRTTVENTIGTLAIQGGSLSAFIMQENSTHIYCSYTNNTYMSNLIFLKSENEEMIQAKDNYFITKQSSPECIVRVYEKEESECVSEFRFKNEGKPRFSYAALSNDKNLLAIPVYTGEDDYDSFGTMSLYLISLENREPPEGDYAVSYENLSEQAKRAYTLGEEFGVKINLYDEASFDSYPYSPETLYDDDLVEDGLDCLENVLEKFPEGFFEELCSANYSEMEINLTGEIKPLDEDEAIDARAYFYVDTQNKYIIVADCSYAYFLEQTFAHELMHAMDEYIYQELISIDNDGYADWYRYLPRNFEYNNDYFDASGEFYEDMKYVDNGGSNLTNVYFLESYQKTYATEDRAVMFEYLFVTGSGFMDSMAWKGLDSRFDNENISNRAIYMCSVIRKCFETVQATEQTQWEKALGITAEDIDSYVNNAA